MNSMKNKLEIGLKVNVKYFFLSFFKKSCLYTKNNFIVDTFGFSFFLF